MIKGKKFGLIRSYILKVMNFIIVKYFFGFSLNFFEFLMNFSGFFKIKNQFSN